MRNPPHVPRHIENLAALAQAAEFVMSTPERFEEFQRDMHERSGHPLTPVQADLAAGNMREAAAWANQKVAFSLAHGFRLS